MSTYSCRFPLRTISRYARREAIANASAILNFPWSAVTTYVSPYSSDPDALPAGVHRILGWTAQRRCSIRDARELTSIVESPCHVRARTPPHFQSGRANTPHD